LRARYWCVLLGAAAVLASCSIPEAAFHPPVCGNGVQEPSEGCEDGNTEDGDGCDSNCMLTGCGNGVATAGEACDDGNLASWDGCDRDCIATALAYVKASNTGMEDAFGTSVALSADGSTLAVGAFGEASASTGVNGNQLDNSAAYAGAVYIFARSGTTWVQQAYLKASNTGVGDDFGWSVALSGDGSTLAVGAFNEDSAATGIGGIQADDSMTNAGAVYVFTRTGATWRQQAYVKASNTGLSDFFGWSVALSGDGSTLAVGAYGEASATTGIDGNQLDNSTPAAGAVYVFTRSGTTWRQQAYVKASNTAYSDVFGYSVALSADGSTLAVGAHGEDSTALGIGGNQSDNLGPEAGAVYVFARSGATWSQQAYVKASNTGAGDIFGWSVALSNDGSTLVVGAPQEDSAALGIDGDQADNTAVNAGATYVFTRSGTWSQQAYVKASNTGTMDLFGYSVAVSGDGSTLVVGAYGEDSVALGTGGDQADNTASDAGAAYVFGRSGATWTQQTYVKASNTDASDHLGVEVAVSGDGSTLALGANREGGAATGIDGNQADNAAPVAGAVYVHY
jgi:trimeric autotransporter adhesin